MKKLLLLTIAVFAIAAVPATAKPGPTLELSANAISGCGYPANSSVLVYVEQNPHREVIVNFESAATDGAGCFLFNPSLSAGNYGVWVFYDPAGQNPYAQFTSGKLRVR